MKLGVGSYTYAWAVGVQGYPAPPEPLKAPGLLDKAATLGIHRVQICDNLPLHAMSSSELEALGRQAADLAIQITVGMRGLEEPHLRTYLALAARFASPVLRIVVDSDTCQPPIQDVVARLRAITPALEGTGLRLAIENHDRFRVKVLGEILERIGSEQVGICLDTANSFGALEGPEQVVSALTPWVVDLHIKDFAVLRAAHKMGFTIEGRPAGQGQLDIPWLIASLRVAGRDPDAILELWTPPEVGQAQTIHKEDQWAGISIAYLRKLIPE